MGLRKWLGDSITGWLTHEREESTGTPMCDFERISYEIRPCDVLLVEGRSRVSDVIKTISQSPWTHAAIYLGRLHDIEDETTREHIKFIYDGNPADQLILEALMGEGTVIRPLSVYNNDHLRICRPKGLSRNDASQVIAYTVRHLGCDYDVRQLLDLARFVFPYGILPRRWRSSLFQHNAGIPTRSVCSSLIAAAFSSVHYPILPVISHGKGGRVTLFKRNFRLYTPSDFDYSPYFDIIKYAYLGLEDMEIYRKLPWDKEGIICNDENDCHVPIDDLSQALTEDNEENEAVLDASAKWKLKRYASINTLKTLLNKKEDDKV